MAKNKYKVPKEDWDQWSKDGQKTFNYVYKYFTREAFPYDEEISGVGTRAVKYNAAFVAAEGVSTKFYDFKAQNKAWERESIKTNNFMKNTTAENKYGIQDGMKRIISKKTNFVDETGKQITKKEWNEKIEQNRIILEGVAKVLLEYAPFEHIQINPK